MSLYFDVLVAGETIGRRLAGDPDETACCLRALAEDADKDFAGELAGYFCRQEDTDTVSEFLLSLAAAIQAAREAV